MTSQGLFARLPAERLYLWGICVAAIAVALAMDAGSYAIYGPAKGLALSLGALLCACGLFLETHERVSPGGQPYPDAPTPVVYLAGAFAVLVLLSLVTSVDHRNAVLGSYPEYVGTMPIMFALLSGFAAYRYGVHRPDLRQFSLVCAAALAVIASYAVLQRFGVDVLEWRATLAVDRVRSTLGNPSNLGVYLVGLIPYAVWSLRRAKTPQGRMTLVAILVLATIALGMTLSRGAWLGAVASAFTWLVLLVRGGSVSEPKAKLRRFVVPALAVAGLLLFVPGVWARITSPWFATGGTGAWRISVWRDWASMIGESPLLGFGPGTLTLVAPRHVSLETAAGIGEGSTLGSAHNVLLDIAAWSGVPALIVAVSLAVVIGSLAWRSLRSPDARDFPVPELSASFVGMLVALQFHFLTLDTMPLVAVTSGLLVATGVRADITGILTAEEGSPRVPLRFVVAGLFAMTALVSVFAFALLLVADRAVSRGWEVLQQGGAWTESSQEFEAARTCVPWEHAYSAAQASAAARVAVASDEPAVADDVLSVVAQAIDDHPLDASYKRHKGDLLSARANISGSAAGYRDALAAYDDALARSPYDVRSLVGAATCLYALGQAEEALAYLERATAVAPDFVPAQELRIEAQAALGRQANSNR